MNIQTNYSAFCSNNMYRKQAQKPQTPPETTFTNFKGAEKVISRATLPVGLGLGAYAVTQKQGWFSDLFDDEPRSRYDDDHPNPNSFPGRIREDYGNHDLVKVGESQYGDVYKHRWELPDGYKSPYDD